MIESRVTRYRLSPLIVAAPVLALCIVGPSQAAEPAPAAAGGSLRASALVGLPVTNDRDQKLGKIDDLMVSRSGTITRVILAVDGGAGLDPKLVAVPFNDVKVSSKGVVYAVTADKLQALPEFKYGPRQIADATDTERARYAGQAKQRMSEWEGRLDKAAKGAGTGANEAGRKLDGAWSDVKNKWSGVENASNDGWKRAKADFEQAWKKLERTWNDATR